MGDCPFCVDRFATCPEHWGEDDERYVGYLWDLWSEPSSLEGPWPTQEVVRCQGVRRKGLKRPKGVREGSYSV